MNPLILFVALPSPVWAVVLLGLCAALCRKAHSRFRFQSAVATALLVIIVVRAGLAIAVATATDLYPISSFACLIGVFGVMASPVVALLELIGVAVLARDWPRSAAGKREGFGAWLGLWLLFNLAVWFAHGRSALLCTV